MALRCAKPYASCPLAVMKNTGVNTPGVNNQVNIKIAQAHKNFCMLLLAIDYIAHKLCSRRNSILTQVRKFFG